MSATPLENLPGFRRRFRVTPAPGRVVCEVEDDYHCMVVEVIHDGTTATEIVADMRRSPWTTCPGAEQQLKETFTGIALAMFPQRGQKKANCTHLYDLAILAARHAFDEAVLVYDILVSDPVDGERRAELRCNGDCLIAWSEKEMRVTAPADFEGMLLYGDLTPWIGTLKPDLQEAAKILRWANMIANGRQIPLEAQSDASTMPPSCYTFQPERAVVATRVGKIKDFSSGTLEPLEDS